MISENTMYELGKSAGRKRCEVSHPSILEAGEARGVKACQATHGRLAHMAYQDGYHLALRLCSRSEARGRFQGAAVVAGLIAFAWIWRS